MIVLDCSAGINMVMRTLDGEALRSLILKNEEVLSSQIYLVEAANVLRKFVKAKTLTEETSLIRLHRAKNLVDTFIPIEENYVEAFHESVRLDHSTYDMLYLTLARRNAATLVTLDTKLMKLCEEQGVDCVHITSL